MTNNNEKFLITGATGKVGGQVVRQLLDAGATNVRALVRDPEAARLPAGVEVVRGDLSDPGSLDAALDGVGWVFLVWPTLRADDAAPETLERITRKARSVVYLSSAGAGTDAPTDPVTGSHTEIERLIRASDAEWTFVRGGGFAGNDLGWTEEIRSTGVVREAFGGWLRSVVHEADLAAVGVRALTTDGRRAGAGVARRAGAGRRRVGEHLPGRARGAHPPVRAGGARAGALRGRRSPLAGPGVGRGAAVRAETAGRRGRGGAAGGTGTARAAPGHAPLGRTPAPAAGRRGRREPAP